MMNNDTKITKKYRGCYKIEVNPYGGKVSQTSITFKIENLKPYGAGYSGWELVCQDAEFTIENFNSLSDAKRWLKYTFDPADYSCFTMN